MASAKRPAQPKRKAPSRSAAKAAPPKRKAPTSKPAAKRPAPKAAPPKVKRDAKGRYMPVKRASGGGRKKSSAMRQYYTEMQPSRRSDPALPTAGTAALSGPPPADLGDSGKFLWELLTLQQQDAEAKGIQPTVSMESYGLAHQYASAFDRWAEVKQTIKTLEAKLPVKDRHMAKWMVDCEGNYSLHGVWKVEAEFRSAAAAAAKTLGLGANHPAVALQVNLNGQQAANDNPVHRLVGPYREANKIMETVNAAEATVVSGV